MRTPFDYAWRIGSKKLDESAIGNGKALVYNSSTDAIEYATVGGGSGGFDSFDCVFKVSGSTYYVYSVAYGNSSGSNFVALINSYRNAGARNFKFLPGTYYVGSTIAMSENYLSFNGSGWNTVFSLSSGVNSHAIEITGDYCILRDLAINGNKSGQSGTSHGIYNHGNNTTIFHLNVYNALTDGIHCGESSWNQDSMGGWLYGSRIAGSGRHGLFMNYTATDYQISDFLINTCSGTDCAGLVVDCSSARISNLHLWGNYYNCILAPAHSVLRVQFVNVGFMDNINHNVYKSSSTSFKNNIFTGCGFWGKLTSGSAERDLIYVGSSGYFRNNAIVGNFFYGENESGTHQARYAINGGTNFLDNTVVGNVVEGFTEANPLNISTSDNQVGYNALYDNG